MLRKIRLKPEEKEQAFTDCLVRLLWEFGFLDGVLAAPIENAVSAAFTKMSVSVCPPDG